MAVASNETTAHAEGWESLTLGSVVETQAKLEQILGFNRITFRASSFLKQRDGGAFCEATAGKRKEILTAALGLDRFPRMQVAVRRDRRGAENEVAQIEGRLQGSSSESLAEARRQIEARISEIAVDESTAGALLYSAEQALEETVRAWQAAQTQESERSAAVARVNAAHAAYEAKAQLRVDALAAAGAAASLKEELDALPHADLGDLEERERTLAAQIEALKDAARARAQAIQLYELRQAEKHTIERQADALDAQVKRLDEQLRHLEAGTLDSCPTCQQQLGTEARAATGLALEERGAALGEEAELLLDRAVAIVLPEIPEEPEPSLAGPQLEGIRQALAQGREAALTRARLMERLAGLSSTIQAAADPEYLQALERAGDERQAAETALAAIPPAGDLDPLQAAAIAARAAVDRERERLQAAQRDKAVEEERLAQHAAREEQARADLAERERLHGQIALLAHLERAYGPSGIPALILENAAIPQIEAEANRILLELGAATAHCRIELRTDRAKKDGGIKDDVLDIIIVTPDGDRPYETFSEGEKTRLNLALRLGLARLLATRRGAESRLLAIDEPDYLDADGMERLATVLRDLEQTGVFDLILLVSHFPALRDSFDSVIEIARENEDGPSRIVGAQILEAVA